MYNILEEILPSEIATKVLTFSRHPTAELLVPHIDKYKQTIKKWEAWFAKKNMTMPEHKFQFTVHVLAKRKRVLGV